MRFGVRLALYGPIAFYVLLAAGLVILQVDGESALGLTLMYWLFIGASQLVYLVPAIAGALLAKRRGVAWGMVRGAGIIAAVNGVAWVIGYYVIGVQYKGEGASQPPNKGKASSELIHPAWRPEAAGPRVWRTPERSMGRQDTCSPRCLH